MVFLGQGAKSDRLFSISCGVGHGLLSIAVEGGGIMNYRVGAMLIGAVLLALEPGFAQEPSWPAQEAPESQLGAPQQGGPAQQPGAQAPLQQSAPLLSPDQLDDLVAPVALYPDPLLSQVLAASTYPLEIVEAEQWLTQNSNLQGTQLMNAARAQNWDPSVQAMVAFPDVLALLSRDVQWTTTLGNAFLAQQADLMAAVQRMRSRAMANGRLRSTPQETVTQATNDGQSAIQIAPANPQVIYVPEYSPAYVWGPPVWDPCPGLWYPALTFGFGFGRGIFMNAFFPGFGLFGWGGWGWGLGWFGHGLGLFTNLAFFNHFGFHGGGYGHWGAFGGGGFGGHGYGGRVPWTHNPGHRMGVPYPNRAVASRFGSTRYGSGSFAGGRSAGGHYASGGTRGGWQGFGNAGRAGGAGYSRGFQSGSRGYTSPNSRSGESYRGYGSGQGYRNSGTYARSFSSMPRGGAYSSSRSYSAPRSFSSPGSFGNARSFSGGGRSYNGGGRSFGGGSHSFSGGGHFSGHSGGGGHFGGGGHSSGHSSGGHSGGGHHR